MVPQVWIPPAGRTKVARARFLPRGSAGYRRRGSSFSRTAFLGPTGGQRSGNERQEQLVVAGDGVAVRLRAALDATGSGGTLHYILQRTVVLNKVEVRRGNGAWWNAKIAHDGNGFEKNLRQQDGGAPIEINAAGMHLLHKRAEQTKVAMSGIAKRCAVGCWMHVRDVRADGQMNRHGNAVFVRRREDAAIRVLRFDDAARKKLPGGFAVADANAVRELGDFVEIFSGFFGHAELAFAEAGCHVFGRVSGERDFEVVDQRRTVHGDSADEAALHQVDQHGTKADFDDVSPNSPENCFALFARNVHRAEKLAEIFRCKNSWK